jgi:predicted  nucleic acid-binding Zn-ribbon protein
VSPQADPFIQRKLLDLAATDRAADTAAHRRRSLPELTVIEGGTKQLTELRAAVVVAETEVGDLDREGRRLDNEIDQVRARSKRDRDRLAAGSGTPRELEGLQHEIDSLDRRQGVLEDEALELMERRETADAALSAAAEARQLVLDDVAAAEQRRDDAFADIDDELARLRVQRAEQAGPLPPDLLALYERIRGTGRVAAAELIGNQCGACRVELDRVAFNAARAAPVDTVVRCENCGAILVRN